MSDPSWTIMDAEVSHSLARTFAKADPENGAALSTRSTRASSTGTSISDEICGRAIVSAWPGARARTAIQRFRWLR